MLSAVLINELRTFYMSCRVDLQEIIRKMLVFIEKLPQAKNNSEMLYIYHMARKTLKQSMLQVERDFIMRLTIRQLTAIYSEIFHAAMTKVLENTNLSEKGTEYIKSEAKNAKMLACSAVIVALETEGDGKSFDIHELNSGILRRKIISILIRPEFFDKIDTDIFILLDNALRSVFEEFAQDLRRKIFFNENAVMLDYCERLLHVKDNAASLRYIYLRFMHAAVGSESNFQGRYSFWSELQPAQVFADLELDFLGYLQRNDFELEFSNEIKEKVNRLFAQVRYSLAEFTSEIRRAHTKSTLKERAVLCKANASARLTIEGLCELHAIKFMDKKYSAFMNIVNLSNTKFLETCRNEVCAPHVKSLTTMVAKQLAPCFEWPQKPKPVATANKADQTQQTTKRARLN